MLLKRTSLALRLIAACRASLVAMTIMSCIGLCPAQVATKPTAPTSRPVESLPKAVLAVPFSPTAQAISKTVKSLSTKEMKGRRAGSPEGTKVGDWLAERFSALKFRPAGDEGSFFQTFTFRTAARQNGKLRIRTAEGRNVIARVPGSDPNLADQHYVIGAHYDHLGQRGDEIMHGADDNASGVSGLLALAQAISELKTPLRRSVILIAFDAEEQGLAGSRFYVRHPVLPLKQCNTMINLDMIGRPEFLDSRGFRMLKRMVGIKKGMSVGVIGGRPSPSLLKLAKAACAADNLPCHAPQDFPLVEQKLEDMAKNRADHAPFAAKKVPHLFFSTCEHDDYHKPSDTADKVSGEVIRRITQAAFRCILCLDTRDQRPAFKQ